MKSCKEHTVDCGNALMVRIQFRQPKPRCPLVRFQSKHMYRNVFNPFWLGIEFLETTGPAALKSLFGGVHGNRGSGRGNESRVRSTEHAKARCCIRYSDSNLSLGTAQKKVKNARLESHTGGMWHMSTRVITLLAYVQTNERRIRSGELEATTSEGGQTSNGPAPTIGALLSCYGSWRVMYRNVRIGYGHGRRRVTIQEGEGISGVRRAAARRNTVSTRAFWLGIRVNAQRTFLQTRQRVRTRTIDVGNTPGNQIGWSRAHSRHFRCDPNPCAAEC